MEYTPKKANEVDFDLENYETLKANEVDFILGGGSSFKELTLGVTLNISGDKGEEVTEGIKWYIPPKANEVNFTLEDYEPSKANEIHFEFGEIEKEIELVERISEIDLIANFESKVMKNYKKELEVSLLIGSDSTEDVTEAAKEYIPPKANEVNFILEDYEPLKANEVDFILGGEITDEKIYINKGVEIDLIPSLSSEFSYNLIKDSTLTLNSSVKKKVSINKGVGLYLSPSLLSKTSSSYKLIKENSLILGASMTKEVVFKTRYNHHMKRRLLK